MRGYTPSQIRDAYGFDDVSGDGTGQTIAIVTAYHDPNLASDLGVFDKQFGLAAPPSLKVVDQTGGTNYVRTDAGWATETALDVEWAHAIAPGAKILVVEANSASLSDLMAAVDTARNAAGVSVVSMSWGAGEFWQETSLDSHFTTPAGHTGVTFVAASGDSGSRFGPEWPSTSANVLSVGGTSLTLDADGYGSETAWAGSGGGTSRYEAQPAWQEGAVSSSTAGSTTLAAFGLFGTFGVYPADATATPLAGGWPGGGGFVRQSSPFLFGGATTTATGRSTPDVSYNADPSTGFAVYSSLSNQGVGGWQEVGGTSAGSPQWAALVAIADQGRALAGKAPLDGPTGTIPALYALYNGTSDSALNDVTTGGSSFFVSATAGYDQVTGLGTPKAALVIQALGGGTATPAATPAVVVVTPVATPAATPTPTTPTTTTTTVTTPPARGKGGHQAPRRHAHNSAADDAPTGDSAPLLATGSLNTPADATFANGRPATGSFDNQVAVVLPGDAGAAAFGQDVISFAAPAGGYAVGATGQGPVAAVRTPFADGPAIALARVAPAAPSAEAAVPAVQRVLAQGTAAVAREAESVWKSFADESSGLLHLGPGPFRLLGLGGLAPRFLTESPDRVWRVTAVVSLAATVAGYGYCRAQAERRRANRRSAGLPCHPAGRGPFGPLP